MTALGETGHGLRRPMSKTIFTAKNVTRIGTWNVRTLNQSGKLHQLFRIFDEYRMDILGVSEARWTENGRISRDGKTFLYTGHERRHERGVGLVLSRRATRALVGWNPVSDRIITARFAFGHAKATVIQVYAPTDCSEDVTKDDFYGQLQDVLDEIPNHDLKVLIGDFNAQLGRDRRGLESVIGPHASSNSFSDNGERLMSFCEHNSLCIGNTYFQHRRIHKKTWRSPDGRTLNEIDFVCISQKWRSSLRDTRAYRKADIGSDHYLVRAEMKLKLKPQRQSIPKRPFATEKLKEPATAEDFALKLRNRFTLLEETTDIEDFWYNVKDITIDCAQTTIGRRRGRRRERWIQDQSWKLIDERKIVKLKRDQARTIEEIQRESRKYAELDRLVKKSCRKDKKKWLEGKGAEAQEAADRNDVRTLYRIVNELSGTKNISSVPIKNKNGKLLTTQDEQHKRWVEHFRETLNQPDPVTTHNFDMENAQEELQVNTGEITIAEVQIAIQTLKNNKAAGLDEISAELLKYGGHTMAKELTLLFNLCWQNGKVPEDWRRGAIVKIPKKGNISECANWRGITLLSVPGKVFCMVLLLRLRDALDQRLREEQAGFRSGRSCSEQIFALRNIIEQCVEFRHPLTINFVDFKKAFDSLHRESLWCILHLYGVPTMFITILKDLYSRSSCCIKTENGHTEFFEITTGVRQGCILSPLLFLVALDYVMRRAGSQAGAGIPWSDHDRLGDLDFADDIALLEENETKLQLATNKLDENASKIGLKINAEKSKVMCINADASVQGIILGTQRLDDVEKFTYLGSVIDKNGDAETDVRCRIGKAAAVFRRLNRIWSSPTISLTIKLRLFNSIVIPTAIYASETWRMSASINHKLNVFQQRCLRRIMKVRYFHHVTNEDILRRSNACKLHDVVARRRLRLAGHILRMSDERIPKTAMEWIPPDGRRPRGRPRHTWRRTFVNDIRELNIAWNDVGTVAQDRSRWRTLAAQYATQHRRI